jgi:hypothetical protein
MAFMAKTCNYDAMGGERLSARLFVTLGGVFWIIAALTAWTVYGNVGFASGQALIPFALAAVALLIGWFYENAAAVLLFIGAAATVVWGVTTGWEAGVWGIMAFVLIGPTIVAGLLFMMAASMQKVCALEDAKARG